MSKPIIPPGRGGFIPPARDAVAMLRILPPLLQSQRRWVGFRLVPVIDSKPKKIPVVAGDGGRKASVTAPTTWRSFDDVLAGVAAGAYTAAAFVLGTHDIIGIDLDGGRWVTAEGEPTEEAQSLIERCGSYAEMSISGHGVHILVRGKLPKGKRANHSAGVEMYGRVRFLITTGRRIDGAADDIAENQAAVDWVHGRYLDGRAEDAGEHPTEITEKTEQTEITELPEKTEDMFSVLSVVSVDIADLITRTMPSGPGERNHRLFEFARGLKFNAGFITAAFPTLKPLVAKWHARALPAIQTKSFDETWTDFVRAWPKATVPLDINLPMAMRDQAKAHPPPAASDYDSPELRLLVGICWHLSKGNAQGRFFLSCRTAGTIIGVPHDRANNMLHTLIADGVITVTAAGTKRRATRFQWIHGNAGKDGA